MNQMSALPAPNYTQEELDAMIAESERLATIQKKEELIKNVKFIVFFIALIIVLYFVMTRFIFRNQSWKVPKVAIIRSLLMALTAVPFGALGYLTIYYPDELRRGIRDLSSIMTPTSLKIWNFKRAIIAEAKKDRDFCMNKNNALDSIEARINDPVAKDQLMVELDAIIMALNNAGQQSANNSMVAIARLKLDQTAIFSLMKELQVELAEYTKFCEDTEARAARIKAASAAPSAPVAATPETHASVPEIPIESVPTSQQIPIEPPQQQVPVLSNEDFAAAKIKELYKSAMGISQQLCNNELPALNLILERLNSGVLDDVEKNTIRATLDTINAKYTDFSSNFFNQFIAIETEVSGPIFQKGIQKLNEDQEYISTIKPVLDCAELIKRRIFDINTQLARNGQPTSSMVMLQPTTLVTSLN